MLAGVAFHDLVLPAIEHILPLLGSANTEVAGDSDSGLARSGEVLHLNLHHRASFRPETGRIGARFIALRDFGKEDRVTARAFGTGHARADTFNQVLGA